MQSSQAKRFHFLDHMRGLVIALVVLQHSVQAYGVQWGGRLWFVDVSDRNHWFDVVFMWTDSFIMQALFFVAGMFVLPSLTRRGWLSFTWEKIARIGIPMLFGIFLLVPPLKYVKYELTQEPGIGYFEYWFDVFLQPESIQAAGFWFLAMLLLFTFIAATLDKILPFISTGLAKFVTWLCMRPMVGYLIVGVICAIIIGYSDIKWGTYWWIGLDDLFDFPRNSWISAFLRLFTARANMLYTYVFLFMLGIGVSKAGVLKNSDILDKASKYWFIWVSLLLTLTFVYGWYNQTYFQEGAFSDEIRGYFYYGGALRDAWPVLKDAAPGILIRTTLHGFLCITQIFTIMILLYRFANIDKGVWASLGACSYGIYFCHEPLVVWIQYLLLDVDLLNTLKMLLAFSIGLGGAWMFTNFVLRKLPITRRVF